MPGTVRLVEALAHAAPGQLTWPAWQALHAGPVLVLDPVAAHHAALRDAGVDAEPCSGGPDDVLRVLRERAGTADVVCLTAAGDPLAAALRHAGLAVEVVAAPAAPPGGRLLDVVTVMDRLRSPGGCPWDAQQTHASLMPYLLEEAYETYQALEDGDPVALREELGDLLLQIVFHARLAEEGEPAWSVDDVAGDLVDKLVRRHPHVFAGASAEDLEGTWDRLKAAEKGRTSVTEGVPLGQPALSLAAKLQRRASRLGAPVPAYDGLGGELWELVRRAAAQGLDPEVELRTVARAFRDALARVERAVRAEGGDPAELSADEWRARWGAAEAGGRV